MCCAEDLKLLVVIPVYSERMYIQEIIQLVKAVGVAHAIIIVDDCSTDGTKDYGAKNCAGRLPYDESAAGMLC